MRVKEDKTKEVYNEHLYFNGSFISISQKVKGDKPIQGYNFTTSTALLDNVISKKEINLFSELEILPQGATPTDAKLDLVDKTGKKINLSPRQLKIVLAFAQVVDSVKDNKAIADYIKELPSKIEWNEEHKSPVTATLDVIKLAKHIYGSSRIGSKQVDSIREDLITLSETSQEFKVKDSKGGTLIMEAPLLTLGKRLKYVTKDGVQRLNVAQITLEDIFLYNLNSNGGYQLSPNTILSLWNKQGANSELFSMLLFLLIRVRGNYVKNAVKLSEEKKKELRKSKAPEDSVKEQVEAYKRKLLTYSESTYSILERLSGETYYQTTKGKSGKRYIKKDKLAKELKQATDALVGMGIITDFCTSTSVGGEEVCNFIFNEKWLQEQEEYQRSILPPDEVKTIDEATTPEGQQSKENM